LTVLSDYVARMVEAGMDQSEAMQIVAEVFAAGAANVPARSSNALRQQRYRDNKKRNESVTNRNAVTPNVKDSDRNESVTNRNETVTRYAGSLSKEEKIEEKKKERAAKRAAPLSDDWAPDEKHWREAIEILGSEERARLELRKFRLHAADKGRLAKNWNAAWVKWALQAVEYGARNGGGNGYRSANSRTTGHDAILAAATREARKIVGDGEMAGPANEAEFPIGHGPDGRTARGHQGPAGSASAGHDGREPFGGPIIEGEVVSADETHARLPGGWRVVG
jgi:hypothetical protein